MSKEDAIKMGLVQIHAMLDHVQDLGEEVIAKWAQAKELHAGHPLRKVLHKEMEEMSNQGIEMVFKASLLASALCATLNDLREKNAVLHDVMKKLSHSYSKLCKMGECTDALSKEL